LLVDYFIPSDNFDSGELLAEWRWLIGEKPVSLLAIAAVGNLFLKGQSGRISLLQIEEGTCECVAESEEQFQERLEERHNRRDWLLGFVVRELRRQRVVLEPGQCYGMKIPLVLGGPAGFESYEPINLLTHVSILGQIHRQIQERSP
jgi:hypothetical protein